MAEFSLPSVATHFSVVLHRDGEKHSGYIPVKTLGTIYLACILPIELCTEDYLLETWGPGEFEIFFHEYTKEELIDVRSGCGFEVSIKPRGTIGQLTHEAQGRSADSH